MDGLAGEVAGDGGEIALPADEDLELFGAEGAVLIPLGLQRVVGTALDRLDLGDLPIDGFLELRLDGGRER
jgi:hypothetical protein